jgi:hypothetical protein
MVGADAGGVEPVRRRDRRNVQHAADGVLGEPLQRRILRGDHREDLSLAGSCEVANPVSKGKTVQQAVSIQTGGVHGVERDPLLLRPVINRTAQQQVQNPPSRQVS